MEPIGLIETLAFHKSEGFFLLERHISRLRSSAQALSFLYDEGRVRAGLHAAIIGEAGPHLRVRLVLFPQGDISTSVQPLTALSHDTCWQVEIAEERWCAEDPRLLHKTTQRARYEEPLALARQRRGVDEILFLNQYGELCEGARTNLFVQEGGDHVLLTPPLSSGLLPGTLRAELLHKGRAREAKLTLNDLRKDSILYLGNSVRGLVRGRLCRSL